MLVKKVGKSTVIKLSLYFLGIVFNDGASWNKTRRIVLKYLKSFGYNSRFMENYISEECRALVKLRTGDAGQPILVNSMFNITIVNILWRLVAGKRSHFYFSFIYTKQVLCH